MRFYTAKVVVGCRSFFHVTEDQNECFFEHNIYLSMVSLAKGVMMPFAPKSNKIHTSHKLLATVMNFNLSLGCLESHKFALVRYCA